MPNRAKQMAPLLLTLLLLFSACAKAPDTEPEPTGTELEAFFFAAGSADAILLTTANSAVLVDTGEKGFGKEILAHLEAHGIERLDYLIVTHFDKDHVGGAAKVINGIEIGTVLQSNRPKDSDEYEKYVKALENAGIVPLTVRENLAFTLDGVSWTVDPPRQERYEDDSSNNSSLIVTVRNGADSFLLMGDAQTARLTEFLSGKPDACTVLKVPHHGRDEPLMQELLQAVSPQYAIITSSEEEPESADTVAALERSGARVLLTREGAVTARSGGAGVEILQNDDEI